MPFVNTVETIANIELGTLSRDMDRRALLYVLSFVRPEIRAVAARQAQRHMFENGIEARTSPKV